MSFAKVTCCAEAGTVLYATTARRTGSSRTVFVIKPSAVRSPRMMRPFTGVRKVEDVVFPAVALAAAATLTLAIFTAFEADPPERTVAGRPIQIAGDGYVSSQTCRACHPSQYASWHASYHRTMTQVATPATVLTRFDGVTVDAIPDEPIRLEQRGQALWAEFNDPDAIRSQPVRNPQATRSRSDRDPTATRSRSDRNPQATRSTSDAHSE